MRRKDKEITDLNEIWAIIEKANVMRVAMVDLHQSPYIIPVLFGFEDNILYFHSASEGKKIDTLHYNNRVCVEMDIDYEIKKHTSPCAWGLKYKSVIGSGKAFFIQELEEKKKALHVIMKHYAPEEIFEFREKPLSRITLLRIELDTLTGKKSES